MTEAEVIGRAETLPRTICGSSITRARSGVIERMRGGGEYGELTIELAASLAAHKDACYS